MRYIDGLQLQLPGGWLERASVATKAVAKGDDPNDHAAVWRELKDALAELFHDKCWYCEMQVTRSDNAVDHFRPKGRVSDAANQHGGYKWLAFDHSNFRYACTFCNSRRKDIDGGTAGGKADRFPLLEEARRVYAKGSHAGERPTLLDPCEFGDWRLLGCRKENGTPCAASEETEQRKRAEVSIEVYHLQHEPLCKLRHTEAVQLLSDIEEAKRLFMETQSDGAQELSFKKVAQRILRAIRLDSPFSGEMRFLLGGERDEAHSWIQSLLET
jgi:hypothetical protein